VRAHGGQVWTLDGRLSADPLDPRPWQVPDLLLEAEDYSADARVFRDAAHQRALWAAWVVALQGAPMDLASIRRLLDATRCSMHSSRSVAAIHVLPTGLTALNTSAAALRIAVLVGSIVAGHASRRRGNAWQPAVVS
jgi:hypothetical protein